MNPYKHLDINNWSSLFRIQTVVAAATMNGGCPTAGTPGVKDTEVRGLGATVEPQTSSGRTQASTTARGRTVGQQTQRGGWAWVVTPRTAVSRASRGRGPTAASTCRRTSCACLEARTVGGGSSPHHLWSSNTRARWQAYIKTSLEQSKLVPSWQMKVIQWFTICFYCIIFENIL